jgi:Bifunctional DNA primase/polymerase, N-terminal/Primase C terminal 1 (PriCT-1)
MSLQYQPNFYQIAEKFIGIGAYVVPAEPEQKRCILDDWQNKATRDLGKVLEWSAQNPRYNCAIVGKPEIGAVWGFDDDGGVLAEYEAEHGKIETYRTKTVSGGTHLLFKHNQASINMGNLSAKNEQNQELWSARTNNRYVISAGSVAHPHNDPEQPLTAYTAVDTSTPIEAPDSFVAFLRAKAGESKPAPAAAPEQPEGVKVHEGGRNNYLASRLGKVHQTGVRMPELLNVALQINEEHCIPPLPDSEVRQTAESIGKYPIKESGQMVFQTAGSSPAPTAAASEIVLPDFKPVAYPKFPDPTWLFKGCSIYDGLVKPICDQNPSRAPEFMMLPAMTLLLNYIANKVYVVDKRLIPSIYMVSIARKGRIFKSASVQDAVDYLKTVGVVDYAHSGTRNAEGKSLVWSAGSPEGLGLEVSRTNCRNFTLFYDELGTLSKKAAIDASSLGTGLCTLYESGFFSNAIKSRKETYSLQPQTYCASLIACTTDRSFISKMAPLVAAADGIDERFFYLLQPEVVPDSAPFVYVNTVAGAAETKRRIERAVLQGAFSITGDTSGLEHLAKINNRVEQRAEKWALFFALDTGSDQIKDEHLERAYELAKYEIAVKKYLAVPEATTREGSLQSEIISHLTRSGGKMLMKDLYKKMHPERHGTSLWASVYFGLVKSGWIAEQGTGIKGDPKTVVLLRVPEAEDE